MCHDTMYCIDDRQGHRRAGARSKALQYGQGGPAIRLRQAMTRPAARRGVQKSGRARPGWWGESRYNRLYRDRRKAWPLGVSRSMLRHGRACATIRPGGARHCRGGCDTTRSSTRHSARHGRCALRQDREEGHYTAEVGLRHGTWCATTWPTQRATCAQPGPWVCAHCALDLVLTQCTVLSHYLGHCSESLFGTLFMSTVHEVFKKK